MILLSATNERLGPPDLFDIAIEVLAVEFVESTETRVSVPMNLTMTFVDSIQCDDATTCRRGSRQNCD
jgi:hypothetical protein